MFQVLLNGNIIYQPLDEELTLFKPKLTLEMGKAGCFEFDIPQTNTHYGELTQLSAMINVNMDTDEIFRGRVLSNERQFNNLRHIYCEGDLAFLVDSVQKTEKYTGKTRALFSKFIAAHNSRVEASKQFTVGEVTIDDRDIVLEGQVDNLNVGDINYRQIAINSIVGEWSDTFEQIKTCLIDYCGGYLRTRYQNGVRYIDYVKDYGGTSQQDIALGTNLLDLTEEISAEDLFTVLIPLGDDNLTISSVNGGSDELVDATAVAKYGRIVRTHVFSNVNEASTLLENARRYLATNVNVPRTVTITAVDLHLLNDSEAAIHIGDKVHIKSEAHELDEDMMCTKIEYDLANPANNKYTFGNPRQPLTERYKEDQRKQNDVYGNGAGGGGRGGGGGAADAADAAGAVADEVNKEEEERSRYFYDTYIDLDAEDDGKITLGAMLRYGRQAKSVLLTDVGIDLDASEGNLNMWALKGSIDENHNLIEGQEARLDVFQSNTDVSLRTLTNRIEEVNGIETSHYTEIKQTSAQNASNITLVAGMLQDESNRAKAKEASIELKVDDNTSTIALKADKVTLNAAVTELTGKLTAQEASFNSLVSGKSTASALYAVYGSFNTLWSGGGEVTTYDHFHSLSADDNGTVTLGRATTDGPTSFNMADTTFYKNGVSAAKASITIDSIDKYGALDYSESFKRYNVPVIATASNGNTGTTTIVVSATKAFDHGVGSVSISSLGAAWSGYTLSATAKASNGASMSNSWNADWIYNEGYSSGSNDGYTSGYREGYQRGYGDGYAQGADDNKPSGNKWITSNGTHDVAGYATVTVRVT